MKKEIIEVPKLSEVLRKTGVPLSPVVRFGNMVFVSGIPPMDPETGKVEVADIRKQTELVLKNIKACLEAAGSSLDNVLKCNVYCANSAYYDEVNKVYGQFFAKNSPARTFATVGSWPWPFDIEIECIAHT
jgi:2-iminobutanoate/2-iminopropanoate deaminase